jgi:hemerythrin superfamily protein
VPLRLLERLPRRLLAHSLRAGERAGFLMRTVQSGGVMDAITLLAEDHQTVEQLFRQFEKLTERAQKSKQKIVMKVIKELAVHAAVEEMFFYPAVRMAALKAETRAAKKAAETVLESLEEHHIVKWTLSELEKMKPEDERYDAKMTVLMEMVRHHVEEEQDELFPAVRKLLEPAVLAELGGRMEKAKRVAPTRPHPRAPDQPPGNLMMGTMAAMMDRTKDMVRDMAEKVARSRGGDA